LEPLIALLSFLRISVADTCVYLTPSDQPLHTSIAEHLQNRHFSHISQLFSSLDSLLVANGKFFYQLHRSSYDQCLYLHLHPGNEVPDTLLLLPISKDMSDTNIIERKNLQTILNQLIGKLSENGFPFAVVKPEIRAFVNEHPVISLKVDTGPKILIHDIVLKSQRPPRYFVIKQLSGVRFPFEYSLKKIDKILQNLAASGMFETTSPPSVLFSEDENLLYLYGNKKQSLFIDALASLNTDNQNRPILTGEANFRFSNTLGYAEDLRISWRAPAALQQFLSISVVTPYLFNTPFGITSGFRLFRQDSTFVQISSSLTATYTFSPQVRSGLGFQREASNTFIASNALLSGFSAVYQRLDLSYFNSLGQGVDRRQFEAEISLLAGTLNTGERRLPRLKSHFSTLLDLPLRGRHKMFSSLRIEYLDGPEILLNESFRTGGYGSLRGFNEWTFFAKIAVLSSLEYRFFLDQFTFFKIFYDNGWQRLTAGEEGYFQGIGTGLALPAGNGLFHLDIAVGKFPGIPLQLRDTRLHIGFSNRF
jgi:outer membrane protein assembly factor BamA